MHCHCHMIPRYAGDVKEPRGGIRQVVPGRGGREARQVLVRQDTAGGWERVYQQRITVKEE